jgi:predicted ester cyclase
MSDTQQESGFAARGTLDGNRDGRLTAELVVRRLIDEGFSQGHLDVCDELIADEIVEHQDYGPGHAPGAAGVKAVVTSLRRAFSDFRLEIEDLVVAGDTVWTRNVATGTNDGPYMGHPPSGRKFRIYVFDVLRVVGGRVVEHWGVPDRVGALIQLGAFSRPSAVRAPEAG